MQRRTANSGDISRDTAEDMFTYFESSSKTTPPSNNREVGWGYNEINEIQHQLKTTSKLEADMEFAQNGTLVQPPVNAYFALPYHRRHLSQPAGLVMTSHHALVPTNPSWSWTPSNTNMYCISPYTHACCPQITTTRRQIWDSSPVPHSYANISQRRWRRDEQHWDELARTRVSGDPGIAEAKEYKEPREECQSMPVIKEFFSMGDDDTDSKTKEEKEKQNEPQDLFHTVSIVTEHKPVSKDDGPGQSGTKQDNETIPLSEPDEKKKENSSGGTLLPSQNGDKPHRCEQCSKTFQKLGNLKRHIITHTSEKSHVCPHCNKNFNRASNLHTHIKIHSSYKPHKCDFCGKGFHQKIDKRIHHYTHTGEKPYKCQKCGRGFKQLTHLNYHMRTHSDKKMYHCSQCGKGFNQKGNLQAHIYGHTGERPFKCDICNKGFTLRSTLNTHIRTHAKIKPFVCEYCNKAFYQKNSLKMHHIASHPTVNGKSIL